jgi:asparagine synthase (glutamine-hydrolysing)
MCGISGVLLKKNCVDDLTSILKCMVSLQSHRGPDFNATWISEKDNFGMGHNRLSILDLSSDGNQPMQSLDKNLTIVFNGEIYNYLELKEKLHNSGSRFNTETDTEVLLEAYRCWGEGMLQKIRGMYAFAIFDHKKSLLFCARDRIGKKPFVYADLKDKFIFASEIPAVLKGMNSDNELNYSAVASIFLHNMRHIPDPYTAYKEVKRLRPGHAIIVKDGVLVKEWRFWEPTLSSLQPTPSNLLRLLEESIKIRMRSDVPVGALLSGGIDSSAIVAIMKKFSEEKIHTYALGYDELDEDIIRARQMSKYLDTKHKEFFFDSDDQWQIYNNLIAVYGEPIALLPLIHSYTLCREIKDDGVKVVLTGNGADEIFYGYSGHIRTLRVSKILEKIYPFRSCLKFLQNTKLSWLSEEVGSRKASYYATNASAIWHHIISDDAIDDLVNYSEEEMRYWGQICPSNSYIDESNFVSLMVENTHSVTTACDLPSMSSSVEMRAPFLDQDLISFAISTPAHLKIPKKKPQNYLKAILRDSVNQYLPKNILTASKRGFGMGIQEKDVFLGPWKKQLEFIFSEPDDLGGFLCKSKINSLWKNFNNNKKHANIISKILALQIWIQSRKSSI